MEWFEIIELRSCVLDNRGLKKELTDLLKAVNTETNKDSIKLFSSDTIDTDFCIYIAHFSGPPTNKSKLGRHIYMVLRKFGLINHKIWIRLSPKQEIK